MSGVADAISQAVSAGASMRTGRVVGITGTQLSIDLGGGRLVNAPYLDSYVPILGDPVQLIFQPPVIWVLGRSSGLPAFPADNVLPNPSFENDATGTSNPAGWTLWQDPANTGTTVPQVRNAGPFGTPDGLNFYEIYMIANGSSSMALVSNQFPVALGQRWTAAVQWQAYADGVTSMVAPLASLNLAWQANPGDAYPTWVQQDTLMQGVGPFGSMTDWPLLRAVVGTGNSVPVGANFVRVVLLANNDCTGGVWFDRAILRRVS
jgi:hypothetical protein